MFETVKKNLLQIQEEIAPCKPRIIAVTKYFDEDAMIAVYNAGLRDFGESRVVEASRKIENLPADIRGNSTFHFIGHLQTNKVKQAIKVFDYIHSVDSIKLAECISQNAQEVGKSQKIFVQVNNANEEQKFGFSKDEILEVFGQIFELPAVEVVGLMNIAPLGLAEDELNLLFADIQELKNEIENTFNCNLAELSMGMSQDYKVAVKNGATMLRIGRKLFK